MPTKRTIDEVMAAGVAATEAAKQAAAIPPAEPTEFSVGTQNPELDLDSPERSRGPRQR
jgi:hypothetical protein